MTEKKSKALTQLHIAALALSGVVFEANAGRVEETYNGDFQYGHYSESGQRMSVDVFETAISAPIGQSMTFSANAVRDVISGASPKYNRKDKNGNIIQTLSSASPSNWCGQSICDQRDAVNANLTYFFDEASFNFGGGFSQEQDYTSRFANTAVSFDFNKKLTTLNLGGSVAFDEVAPSVYNGDCGDKCYKTDQNYLIGLTQIIDKDSLIQNNMTFGYNQGYLSDPYKEVRFYHSITGNPSDFGKDVRPREKFSWAWLTQYVRHFGDLNNAALHIDYRFSTDDWGINAHTAELTWYQPIADGWQIIPRFRYYSQDKADFYAPVFEGKKTDFQYYSSDYRLANFGAISGGLKLSKEFTHLKALENLKFQAGIEYYDHKANYQLGNNNAGNFSDFSYYLVTASFNLKF